MNTPVFQPHAEGPRRAGIRDASAGPGADIDGHLANAPGGHVLAIDLHAPFIARTAALRPGPGPAPIEAALGRETRNRWGSALAKVRPA